MNCDNFLSALETGGFFQHLAARRHVANCPACARALAGWTALKHELAAAPPLTDRQRKLWTSVARPNILQPRTRYLGRVAAVAVAACVVFVLFWVFHGRNLPPREVPTPLP